MDTLEKASFKTSRNFTYTYYKTPTSDRDKPWIALFHGWPDDAFMWKDVVPYLQKLEYPLIIPDLLGYAGTDKPSDPALYNSRDMTKDMIEILNHEKIQTIVSTGHDWGSFFAARMWLWHPQIVVGLIMLNVTYNPPAQEPFDLDGANEALTQMTRRPRLAYWELFTEPDGHKLLTAHPESVWCALHGDVDGWMEEMFCTRGTFREFLLQDKTVPLKKYAQGPEKRIWIERMRRDGFEGPSNWYKAVRFNHHYDAEKDIPPQNFVVAVPTLYIGCTEDRVCLHEMIEIPRKAGLLPSLEKKIFESGHWCTMEIPDQIGSAMADWIKAQNFVDG